MAIGVWPNRCSRARPITVSSDADVQARGGRVEPDVAGHRRGGERLAHALGGVRKHVAPFEFA